MKADDAPKARGTALRELAEQTLSQAGERKERLPSEAETMRLVHELKVHQIELELQNEALRAAQVEVEAGLRHYTRLFDFAPVGYLRLSLDGVIQESNLAAATLLSTERARLKGARFQSFLSEASRSEFATFLMSAFAGGHPGRAELVVAPPGQTPRDIVLTGSASPDEGECLVTLLDVTEQRRLAAVARASEERYRSIVESTSEGVITTDTVGHLTFVNARFAQMLGYAPGEMLRRGGLDFVEKAAQKLSEPRVEQRHKLQHKNGQDLWVRVISSPLLDGLGRHEGTLALVSDVTQARLAEEMSGRLAAIVESSADAIVGTDAAGLVTSWNEGATKLYGYTSDEMLGAPASVLVPTEAPLLERGTLERVLSGESVLDQHVRRKRKDGATVEVSLTMSPIRSAEREIVGVSCVARDLTERQLAQAALHHTEAQLHQAQKIEAIGKLAGGVAHDFNNLLSVILGYATLCLEDSAPDRPFHRELTQIELAARRGADLTQQLLVFSRSQVIKPQLMDLNACVRSLSGMLARVLGAEISLTVDASAERTHVLADRGQLEQVVLNLVLNARDAMPAGGEIRIETQDVEVGAEQHPDAHPGPHILLSVADTGQGIDPAVLPRIFEPFFTTKEQGKGTGLGLSTAYGIVTHAGGHIEVRSVLGQGTTFWVYLPCAAERGSEVSVRPSPLARAAQGTETILVVDDEELVRDTTAAILRRGGYHVLVAGSAGDAILLFERHAARIDLLVTDVVMPNMNGKQLAERVLLLKPELRVLYVSGHPKDVFFGEGPLDTKARGYLEKPLSPSALLTRVRELLDGELPAVQA